MRNMRLPLLREWTGRSLLVALFACNASLIAAIARADAPATRPATDAALANPQPVVDVRKTVEYLASDELEGRGAGTKGIDLAADHIAGAFAKLKLQPPPGWTGHFQPFSLTTSTTVDPKTTLAAARGTTGRNRSRTGCGSRRNTSR